MLEYLNVLHEIYWGTVLSLNIKYICFYSPCKHSMDTTFLHSYFDHNRLWHHDGAQKALDLGASQFSGFKLDQLIHVLIFTYSST